MLSVDVGVSIQIIVDPGDLKYRIKREYMKEFVPFSLASLKLYLPFLQLLVFLLRPKSPASKNFPYVGGWIFRLLYKNRFKNAVRMHNLCGIAKANVKFSVYL